MKREMIIAIVFLLIAGNVSAQKYLTKNGHINFYSKAPMEDIEADNHQVNSILDVETGDLVFSLLMKGFHFEKALMEEHFNEKYVHSDKFPKATFKGRILNMDAMDLNTNDPQKVSVEGQLTIHGITREVTATGTITPNDGQLKANAVFEILVEDYGIEIPRVVVNNIAKNIRITVDMIYEPYNP